MGFPDKGLAALSAFFFAFSLSSCSPAARGKALRIFFDGVPDETAKTEAAGSSQKKPNAEGAGMLSEKPEVPKVFSHEPFAEQMCDSCHDSKFSQKLLQKGKALCFTCHDDFSDRKKSVHYPLSDDQCLECHEPHQSPNQHLLKKTVPEICWSCHDDFSKGKGIRTVHPPVKEGMCFQCHDPHASDNEPMLKQPVPALCFTCHEKETIMKQSQHEDVEDCLDCHEAHAAKEEKLLQ